MSTKHFITALSMLLSGSMAWGQKVWTLQECLDYALANNIQLQQKRITAASDHEDVLQSKAALFPSVSFSTNQNASWRPFAETTINLAGGTMTTNSNTVSYNGSYGINANWTVWNGNRNTNTIKQNKLTEKIAELGVEQQANTIQEQIAQLYVQILYETEAVNVCREIIKSSMMQRDRAKTMVEVGSLARVDLVQLEAQVSQDEYSLVSAQSQLANYKLQLKQLLEIHDDETFDIAIPEVSDAQVLAMIPNEQAVYNAALESRPEIQSGKLNIESSEIAIHSARAGYKPTVSLTAGIGSSNSSGQDTDFFKQVKTNMNNSLGLSVSIPIVDNHQTRTNIRKAKYALQTSELNLQEQQKQLYSTIENYWLNATTSQQQFISARNNVKSMQESYDLVSEQFNLGLKNIVELTTGKNNLLQAEQQLLQTKYTALLNAAMLNFYAGENIKL
ncbi:MAG: TolC family protein [Bacteroidales bacterium]|jgi:outer membrane protein|nr:TolC family protein [Bacteroidaceae bacterium]MBR6973772.1 TolC family protein [Bacteroidaceae bacterium]MDO4201215.1 TolC family protein [Bacteroidales bacterium]